MSSVARGRCWKSSRIWCWFASLREKTTTSSGMPTSPSSSLRVITRPNEPVPPVTTTRLPSSIGPSSVRLGAWSLGALPLLPTPGPVGPPPQPRCATRAPAPLAVGGQLGDPAIALAELLVQLPVLGAQGLELGLVRVAALLLGVGLHRAGSGAVGGHGRRARGHELVEARGAAGLRAARVEASQVAAGKAREQEALAPAV